jgi:hypothetical protein
MRSDGCVVVALQA